MVLYMYVGSLFPYIEGLDSWLFEGTLDDPCDEVIIIESLILYTEGRGVLCFLFCAKDCTESTLICIGSSCRNKGSFYKCTRYKKVFCW